MRIGYVRFLIACLMAVALPACAGSATPQPSGGSIPPTVTSSPASLVITDADHGKTYELHLWESAELHLSSHYLWGRPHIQGRSVRVDQINYLVGPGYSGWTLTAVETGRSIITVTGGINCSPGQACPALAIVFTVTIDVS